MLGALWPAWQSCGANSLSVLRISLTLPRSRGPSARSMIYNGRVVREVSENWWQEDESPVEYGK